MAVIQASVEIKGEAGTQAQAGARYAVSAQCFGRASAANSRAPREPAPLPEPKGS